MTESLARWRERWRCPGTVELRDDDRTLRLTLSEPLHAAILRAHLDRHDEAILTETAPDGAFGWIGDHAHEIAVPLVATRAPAPSGLSGRPLPTLLNGSLGPMPGAPDAPWLHAKLHTHPEQMTEIITGHLPQLLAALPGDSEWWFLRYRSRALTELGYVVISEELLEGNYNGPSLLPRHVQRPSWWHRSFGIF